MTEHTGRRRSSSSQGERLQKPARSTPRPQTSGLQNMRKRMWFLTTLLLWQPKQTSYQAVVLNCTKKIQAQFLESTPFSTPTVTFFTQSTSFNPYGAHNSSNRNTTLQRCPCPNARARKYITLYGKGALRI